ncbi:MAG TPA: histidine kinase dimerization/phospho-acceptor domain-containing protein, partial [Spongiibacteraceae bacterium]|nr:histidine kinase dimerization/phospho-acceptor domain-containing protein [Spongiibacteraceae bacterium]
MGKTALNSKNFGYQPETAATATRHIADKARFGVLYYLFSLVGIFSIAPNLQFQSLQFVLLLIALLLLSALREFVYRLSHNEDKPITRAQHYLQASYLLNGIVWSILSFIVFKSERALSGTAAATLITSVGLTAGGVTAIVPHFALIQRYSLLMMGTTGVMLPLLIADIATWYIAPLCFLYVFFLLGMGKRQCNIYWQLIESNQTLHRQTERLAAAQVEAVAGARAKTEFLANMSHEIRTPMNGVIGVAELLEKTPLNDQQKDYLKIIREAGTTLLTIIDDVLDFSKLEAKKMSLSEEPVDLDALVRNLQALFSLQLQNTDVHL